MTQPPIVLLDASCLLNFYATGRLRDIALALPFRLGAAEYVLEQEALYIWRPGPDREQEDRVKVDLSPLVEEGVILVLRLEHQEEEATFVDLAALVDDGEAISAALALNHGCGLATDDRKARRVVSEYAPSVSLMSTLGILKEWSERNLVKSPELRDVMLTMQRSASYIPSERDPLYGWWRATLLGENAG